MNEPMNTLLRIELELTPRWWLQLTQRMSQGAAYEPIRALHAQAVDVAFKLGPGVRLLKTKRTSFVAQLQVPRDTSLALLCEKAGAVIEELNALDVSCLAEARAKYL